MTPLLQAPKLFTQLRLIRSQYQSVGIFYQGDGTNVQDPLFLFVTALRTEVTRELAVAPQ